MTRRLSPLVALASLTLTLAACGNDTTTPSPTTVVVNPSSGIRCLADAQCPWGMFCGEVNDDHMCLVKPPDPEQLWATVTVPYDHIKHDSAMVVLYSNENVSYKMDSFDKKDSSWTGLLTKNTPAPILIQDLKPETSYLLLMEAKSVKTGEIMNTWTSFKTMQAPPSPKFNFATIDHVQADNTVLVNFNLTAPAVVRIFFRTLPNDPWVQIYTTGTPISSKVGTFGPFRGGQYTYWRVVAIDENDNPVDSVEDQVWIP